MSINDDFFVDLYFKLNWESEKVSHEDAYFASRVNLWRDILPHEAEKWIRGSNKKESASFNMEAKDLGLPARDGSKIKKMASNRFVAASAVGRPIRPHTGRFYPQGFLQGVTGVFPQTIKPFRCLQSRESDFAADLNHPFAGRETQMDIEILDCQEKDMELGGTCKAWMEIIAEGPGMQARIDDKPTDFFEQDAFVRKDESSDSDYYSRPRMTAHIDSRTRKNVSRLYSRHLSKGDQVLDLMSSTFSHFPEGLELGNVKGLGMNSEEMAENGRLDAYTVQDLNLNPKLPYADAEFDVVVCCMSVEYLISPLKVLDEVYRVLRPDGKVIISFSHRWFPGKAVKLWTEMHEFERLGFVAELVLLNGGFRNVCTFSERGWPRPFDERDRYYPMLQLSDPLYAVWGTKK